MLNDFFCDYFSWFCGSGDPDLNEIIDWTDKTQNHNERIKFLVLHHTVSDSPADTIAAFNAGGRKCTFKSFRRPKAKCQDNNCLKKFKASMLSCSIFIPLFLDLAICKHNSEILP